MVIYTETPIRSASGTVSGARLRPPSPHPYPMTPTATTQHAMSNPITSRGRRFRARRPGPPVQVDDLVDGREDREHRVRPCRDPCAGCAPDSGVEALDFLAVGRLRTRAEPAGNLDAVLGVASQGRTQLRPVGLVQQVRAQVGRADRVCLLHDQVLPLEESCAGRREAEGEQESQQAQKRSLDGADLAAQAGVRTTGRAPTDPEPCFERGKERERAGRQRLKCPG